MKIAVNTSAVTRDGDIDFSEFEKLGEVKYFDELPREEIFKVCRDCDAVVVNKVIVDKKFLDNCPSLKYVGVFATGYDVVDLKECSLRHITVCNVPDYSTEAVAQHVFALLLSFCGKIPDYVASVRRGDWIKSPTFCYFPWASIELSGKTLGVFGYGSIGKRVAQIGEALGMRVLVCNRRPPQNCPYKSVDRRELFASSDVLSLNCPLTEETKNIINAQTLSEMKSGAILINTARGGLVDEAALASALKSGKLSGACLDVVAEEPMAADNPLYKIENCYITPHVAWTAYETRKRVVGIAALNLKRWIEGSPQNVVQ